MEVTLLHGWIKKKAPLQLTELHSWRAEWSRVSAYWWYSASENTALWFFHLTKLRLCSNVSLRIQRDEGTNVGPQEAAPILWEEGGGCSCWAWSVRVCAQIHLTWIIYIAALKQRAKDWEMPPIWVPSRQQSNPFRPVFCRGHFSVPRIVLSMEKAYQGNFAEPPAHPLNSTQQIAIKDALAALLWPVKRHKPIWGPFTWENLVFHG